jgi:hypothetical protein
MVNQSNRTEIYGLVSIGQSGLDVEVCGEE